MAHKPSLAFRGISSIFLSASYFVFAIGIWAVQSNKLLTSADVISTGYTCKAPSQVTEANIPDTGLGSYTVATGSTRSGTISFDWLIPATLEAANLHSINDTFTLAGPNGTFMSFNISAVAATSGNTINVTSSNSLNGSPANIVMKPLQTVGGNSGGALMGAVARVDITWNQSSFTATFRRPVPVSSSATAMPQWWTGFWPALGIATEQVPTLTGTPMTAGPVERIVFQSGNIIGPTDSTSLSPNTGSGVYNLVHPVGTTEPCIASITDSINSGSEMTLTGINFSSSDTITLTPSKGGNPVVITGNSSNGTSESVVIPTGTAAGVYYVTLANSKGTSQAAKLTLYSISIEPVPANNTANTLASSGLICSDKSARSNTDTFENYPTGSFTSLSNWVTVKKPQTDALISADAAKDGSKGLKIVDTNLETETNRYEGYVAVARDIRPTTTGSVEIDAKVVSQTGNHVFNFEVAGSQQGSGTASVFIYTYMRNGTFQYWDNTKSGGYVVMNPAKTYKDGQWYRLKIEWLGSTFNFYADGEKINTTPLPYSYASDPATGLSNTNVLATSIAFASNYEPGTTGTYYVDNVTYPGCTDATLALAVSPLTGHAPLAVNSTVTLPYINLVGSNATELNDVGAAADQHLVYTKNADGIHFTGAPTASTIAAAPGKCWLYDLDQARINQLQWKQTLPDNMVVVASINWDVTDSAKGAMNQGGIGFIDSDGYFQDWAGFSDGMGSAGDYGVLGTAVKDGQKPTLQCNVTPTNPNEWTIAEPSQSGTTFTGLASPTGTADLQLIKNGQHVKIYINGKLVREHDLTGTIAGIALGVSGFPEYPFGKFNVTRLQYWNSAVSMDMGDGTKGTCKADPTAMSCDNAKLTLAGFGLGADATANILHTFDTVGNYVITATNAGQSASQSVNVTTPIVVASTSPSPTATPTVTSTAATQTVEAKPIMKLISTGGNLIFNVAIAALLSLLTTYFFLRRHHEDEMEAPIQ